jgi:alpha-glucosidase
MHDFGYDVSDYCDIHPLFGSMSDFDRLLAEVHQRGLKLILDLVPNHTSDQHPWFLESRTSRDSPKRDWYIWRDPAPDGGIPNNWLSFFGGPAWTFAAKTGQYYLHQFVRQQPELNYRNHAVMAAVLDTMRFWLDKGVNGFRVDVIWLMVKDSLFRDEPPNPDWNGVNPFDKLQHIYTANLPEVHALIRQMRSTLDDHADRMMVGEIYLPIEELVKYYGAPGQEECHLPFNFQLIDAKWDAEVIKRLVDDYEAALPANAWPNWVLGNHDRHRLASRIGIHQARVAALLLLTLRGTPTCYYGDELGMDDVPIPPEKVQDPPAVNQPELAHIVGRDPVRTPLQWDDSAHAGFSAPGARSPWLPIAANFREVNVAKELSIPDSLLNLYRRLLAYRKSSSALKIGSYHSVEINSAEAQKHCFVYERRSNDQHLMVALNFSNQTQYLSLPFSGSGEIVLSTSLGRAGRVDLAKIRLSPDEGCMIQLGDIE